MPYLATTENVSLFYTDYPGNRPVVFAHAWALNGDMWSYQLTDFLTAGYRCITYDRRGHGRSDRPPTGYDIDTLADDLASIIEGLDLSDVTLVGHSMGAGEVVRYLTRHGDRRIARVVLSGTVTPMLLQGPDNPDGIPVDAVAQMRSVMLRDIGEWIKISGKTEYFAGEHRVSQQLMDWTLNTIAAVPLPILTATSDTFMRADFRAELTGQTVPTLIIHGTADASMPIERTALKTAALMPGCRLVTIDGAGHGMYLSEAPRYNAALLEFISSTPASATASR